jgi:hypothetical protein
MGPSASPSRGPKPSLSPSFSRSDAGPSKDPSSAPSAAPRSMPSSEPCPVPSFFAKFVLVRAPLPALSLALHQALLSNCIADFAPKRRYKLFTKQCLKCFTLHFAKLKTKCQASSVPSPSPCDQAFLRLQAQHRAVVPSQVLHKVLHLIRLLSCPLDRRLVSRPALYPVLYPAPLVASLRWNSG